MSKPPVAAKKDHIHEIHGDKRPDPYFWMKDKEDKAVIAHLEAENQYFADQMKPLAGLTDKIFKEIKGRIQERDESVPAKCDDYLYGSRFEEGKEYEIHFRRLNGVAEEVIFDENERAAKLDYYSLGTFNWSHDHRLLAFSEDVDGSEKYTLRFLDLQTGLILRDEIPDTYYGFAWAKDNRTVFYVKLDEHQKPNQVYRHVVGTDVSCDELVYDEQDGRFFVGLGESQSSDYIFISSDGNNMSEAWWLPSDKPQDDFKCLAPRTKGVEYGVDHQGDSFIVLTNEDAVDFRVMRAEIAEPARENWEEVVPHRPGRLLTNFICFKDYLVVFEKEQAKPNVRVYANDGASHTIQFPEEIGSVGAGSNYEYDSRQLRVSFASPVTPDTTYDYDLENRTLAVRKVRVVPSGYDRSRYELFRVMAPAKDGALIPVTLVHQAGLSLDGSSPVYMNGYGSYGMGYPTRFSVSTLSLVDRGFVVAIAHVRGGDDMGRDWYEDGKMLRKMNTFTDFVACAEALIAKKYTSAGKIIGSGGSAGGMLVGAVANLRPDLFAGIIAQVPFVDCVTTMLDDTLPLTQLEYNEWGNPNVKQYYDSIRSYSPYDNVKAQAYPNMFVSSGLNDPRVTYWEPTKWVARLRETKTDNNMLVLKTNMGAGHGGNTGRFEHLKETAAEFAFACKVVGIEN